MNIQDQIAVMQAFADGKEIEFLHSDEWCKASTPVWNWTSYDYRIKEVPRCFTFMGKDYKLREGEKYVGTIVSTDGSRNHHIILLPGAVSEKTWKDAKAWAESIGGELPDRSEGALLFATMKDEFEEEWYWTREAQASAGYAWYQSFRYGHQYGGVIRGKLRARAVRRIKVSA